MKKNIRRVAALIAVVCLVFSLVACTSGHGAVNKKGDPIMYIVSQVYGADGSVIDSNVVGSQTYDPQAQQPATQAPATPAETTPNQTTAPAAQTPAGTTAAAGQSTTAAPAAPGNAKPTTTAEILAYYKTAYAKVCSSAASVTKIYTNTTNQPAICEAGRLSSIASTLMNQFLKAAELSEVHDDPADLPPTGNKTCNLTEASIGTASCDDKGTYYELKITLKMTQDSPEINPPAGGGATGTILNVVEPSDITEAASMIKFENLQNKYFGASLTAKIDKATGNMTELYLVNPSIMHFDKVTALMLSVENANIGLTYEERWTVQW